VAVFHEEASDDADATFIATKDLLDRILLGETNVEKALAAGELKIEGDQAAATEFFGYFDPPGSDAIKLVVR
jgi:putative sterol carrier protein